MTNALVWEHWGLNVYTSCVKHRASNLPDEPRRDSQAARTGVRTSVRRRQNSFYGYTNTTTVGTTDRSKMRHTTGGELWALWSPIRPGEAYGGRDTFPYTKVQDGVHSRGISSGSAEGRRGVQTASQWPEEIQQKLHGPSSLEDAWTGSWIQ